LSEWIDKQPDLTLHELQARLQSELKLKASIGRLWSLLREMGLRLKTSRSTRPNKTVKPTKNGAPRGASKSAESIRIS
jgi:transposase